MTGTQATACQCAFCAATLPDIEQAANDGWHPSFWFKDQQRDEPVCGICAGLYLTESEDGEFEANAIGRRLLMDREAMLRMSRKPRQRLTYRELTKILAKRPSGHT